MLEVKRGGTKRLAVNTGATATAVKITLTHELGTVLLNQANTSGSGANWYYDLTADNTNVCGVIKVTWNYNIGATPKKQVEYFKVYQPYTSESDLVATFPELDGKTDDFSRVEKTIRGIVDTYCGQSFDAMPGITVKVDGSGSNMLHVWYRIEELTNVYVDGDLTNDIAAYVEVTPDSDFYIRRKNSGGDGNKSEAFERMFTSTEYSHRFFNKKRVYHIKGDFGWGYVPSNVEEATKLLMQDWYNQDSIHRRHGVIFSGVGPVQNNYQTDLVGTTGNIDADVLLMDYTKFVMDYI